MSGPSTWRALLTILGKDLRVELRTLQSIPAMVLFSTTIYVIFRFGLDRTSLDGGLAAGVLLVTVLFAALLAINRLFVAEREQGGFEAVRLAPVDGTALFLAKALALFAYLVVLELVSLADRASRRVGEMSAGMVKRLAVCRALLHDPELLVLDEPLANLDPAGAEVVAPLLGPRPGRSRILVTHDVAAALTGADRVLALRRDGGVAFEQDAAAVDPERARAIYSEDSLRGAT